MSVSCVCQHGADDHDPACLIADCDCQMFRVALAHPDGYSEPPGPRRFEPCDLTHRPGTTHHHPSKVIGAIRDFEARSGYSESGERDREAAVREWWWDEISGPHRPGDHCGAPGSWWHELGVLRYRHANIEMPDPANGAPMRGCAMDREAWPCSAVEALDAAATFLLRGASPQPKEPEAGLRATLELLIADITAELGPGRAVTKADPPGAAAYDAGIRYVLGRIRTALSHPTSTPEAPE